MHLLLFSTLTLSLIFQFVCGVKGTQNAAASILTGEIVVVVVESAFEY